jgi:aspartate/methionine/tyrosine aminotransferase
MRDFALEVYFSKWEFAAKYNLAGSDGENMTLAVVRDNLVILNAFFADYEHLFDWREPDGGCVGFIRYKGAEGVEEFTRRLVEESGVLFLPSSIYRSQLGPVPENCLRVGFGRSHVPQGLAALRNWFELKHH